MDDDQVQRNAIEHVFANMPTLICIWHENQCIQGKCKSLACDEDWPIFEGAWRGVIQIKTIEQFDSLWHTF